MRLKILIVILLLGAYSQIVQALLIREGLVVFYGNEVSLGAFFSSWLFWLAMGSLLVIRLRDNPWVSQPLPWVGRLLLVLPLVLGLQILMFRLLRHLLDVSASEFVPLTQLLISLFLITLPSGILLGISFPLACKALKESYAGHDPGIGVRVISRLYMLDAVGALLGGVLFTFVLVQWVGISSILGLSLFLLSLLAVWLVADRGGWHWTGMFFIGLGLVTALPPINGLIDRQLESLRFSALQPGLELKESIETKYGHLALAGLGSQTSLVSNGQVTQSFPLPLAVRQEAAYFMAQAAGAQRVLVLGGFAGGLVSEMLHYPVNRIYVLEEDKRAFATTTKYLPDESLQALNDPRVHLQFMDGRRYVNGLAPDERFDLVLVLDATPSNAFGNRYFTTEFYQLIDRHLVHDGVLCTRVSGASNYLGRVVGSFTGSVFHTLRDTFPHVAVSPGDVYSYCASASPGRVTEDPFELERRYLQLELEERRIALKLFHTLLQADEITYARNQLEQVGGDINSDERPVTYYLNMLLWGQFSASAFSDWMEQLRQLGVWIYLLPLLVFITLWLIRSSLEGFVRARLLQRSATLCLIILGMLAMAAQLVVLLGYQSHLGFVFERVALLNGLFMTGLALGAGLGESLSRSGKAAERLALVLLMVCVAMLAMPSLLGMLGRLADDLREWGYLGLSLYWGLLAGCGFPLGVKLTEQEQAIVVRSSGITEAADNFGGALGGLLTGTLMVPILGNNWTCYLMAMFAGLTLIPLLYAAWVPRRIPWFVQRGYVAFPVSVVGWWLTGLVVLAFAWALVQQSLQPAPQLQFSDHRLMQVSGSETLNEVVEPFIHYLGGSEHQPSNTVSLASMAAAPGVQGYAGNINLLVSVDLQGILRGVQYVDSNETPVYIAGIQSWLDGLRGRDLAKESLTLEKIDGLSGATVTSKAALQAINLSVGAGAKVAFDKNFTTARDKIDGEGWISTSLLMVLGLLLLFFPVYLSGRESWRLAYQFCTLMVLGVWLNNQLTEVDLVNLGLGHFAPLTQIPQHWIIIGFSMLTALLFGPVWCGYLCPFGALQEFISRAGWYLGLRSYPSRPLDQWLRYLKYLLLALLLCLVWFSGDPSWALFDPMQYAFGETWPVWMVAILAVVLLGALFYYRFWCRYLCPVGAFLALGNKFALLQHHAPKRRFNHCDLGVRHEFDIDCIRCQRCLTGKDTHLKPKLRNMD